MIGPAAIRWGKRQSDIQNRYTPQKYGGRAAVTMGNSVNAENERGKL
jgi:hypothetical protein